MSSNSDMEVEFRQEKSTNNFDSPALSDPQPTKVTVTALVQATVGINIAKKAGSTPSPPPKVKPSPLTKAQTYPNENWYTVRTTCDCAHDMIRDDGGEAIVALRELRASARASPVPQPECVGHLIVQILSSSRNNCVISMADTP
ncbi:hypothetical protein EVAR_87387_1 [Eumeta japonica]|uniref:Uncharacterized protein n=1 Tax=Eumeta variegata TaxID=151549 RepID=A0A4C1Y3J7_EUMVA|nr:hypothetical protein EVAR_87387_1 [Eumeta japonica]